MTKKFFFNDEFGLTKAVLKGKKTMTRRICKYSRPDYTYDAVFPVFSAEDYDEDGNIISPLNKAFGWATRDGKFTGWNKAQYRIGEVVAVAQSYKVLYNDPLSMIGSNLKYSKGWNNKMFVRADLMPHKIQITDISIQKLQDISNEDCLKEGINEATRDFPWYWYEYNNKKFIFNEPRQAFAALIDKVSGKGTWDSNPYVFIYEFKLIK